MDEPVQQVRIMGDGFEPGAQSVLRVGSSATIFPPSSPTSRKALTPVPRRTRSTPATSPPPEARSRHRRHGWATPRRESSCPFNSSVL